MPKPPTVFMGDMTDREVQAFLREHQTVIVPTGSTEQHGPHGPLLTDALVPTEVARRVAPQVGALVAPPINYGAVLPAHRVHRASSTSGSRRSWRSSRTCARGWRRSASAGSSSSTATTTTPTRSPTPAPPRPTALPPGTRAFPVNYWDGITAEEAAEYFGPTAGLHANKAETSAVMAIDPALVDLDAANAEMPPFPDVTNAAAVHTAFFFSAPGLRPRGEHVGHVGRRARVERRVRRGVPRGRHPARRCRMLDDIERTFAAMPGR